MHWECGAVQLGGCSQALCFSLLLGEQGAAVAAAAAVTQLFLQQAKGNAGPR